MATITARNNTVSVVSIQDLGIDFANSEIKILTNYFKFIDLVQSINLVTLVDTQTISLSVDGGVVYLNRTDALNLLSVESEYEDLIQDASINNVVTIEAKYCGAATNADWTIPNTTYTNVPYNVADYQNDTDVLEWLVSQPTRITVKQSGNYRIGVGTYVRNNTSGGTTATNMASTYIRFQKNGNTIVLAEQYCHTYYLEVQQSYENCVVYLDAGDYVTVQMYSEIGKNVTLTRSRFSILKLEGVEGPAGPAGGTTVTVQQAGTPITTNTNILNFQGNAVDVTSGGTGNAIITINQPTSVFKYIHVIDITGNQNLNISSPGMVVTWDTQALRDTDTFNHSTGTNPSRITVLVSGWYKVSYNLTYNLATARTGIKTYIRKNGNTILLTTSSYGYEYVTGLSNNNAGDILIQLAANEWIELMSIRRLISGTMYTVAGESSLTIELIRTI